MVRQQPHAPFVADIVIVDGFFNINTLQRISRAIDMRFYWVCDIVIQGHYLMYWFFYKYNLAKSFAKNHPTKYHRAIGRTYLVPTVNAKKHSCYMLPSDLGGCVEYLPTQVNL